MHVWQYFLGRETRISHYNVKIWSKKLNFGLIYAKNDPNWPKSILGGENVI